MWELVLETEIKTMVTPDCSDPLSVIAPEGFRSILKAHPSFCLFGLVLPTVCDMERRC